MWTDSVTTEGNAQYAVPACWTNIKLCGDEMRLLITGDWHIDNYKPENRTDDYFLSQFGKIKWIFEFAFKQDCWIILQPGDMFNSHKASDFLKQHYINYFLDRLNITDGHTRDFFTIFGQHDLRYHSSDRKNTPLRVLESSEACTVLSNDMPVSVLDDNNRMHHFYGANWGEEIPELVDDPQAIHILLIHTLVVEDIEGWEEKFIYADNMFKFCKHDFMICGDNHLRFTKQKGMRTVFNCGSLMRTRIDQADHKPAVYVLDTADMSWWEALVPIKPFEEVMDVRTATAKKERNEELESFVEKLSGDIEIQGLDFKRNVSTYLSENKEDPRVEQFILEVMQ